MINSQSVADQTAIFLENLIISGKLAGGQKIKEQEISDLLGVSRFPIREAFKLLEGKGLIYREPRKGVYVSKLEAKDVWEIYTLKVALYCLSVTLAMEKISGKNIKKLKRIVESMEEIANSINHNVSKYQELNDIFHFSIIEITGHERLRKLVKSMNDQIKRISYKSFSDREYLKQSFYYHKMIFEAIERGDVSGAEKLTKEHILKGLEKYKQIHQMA